MLVLLPPSETKADGGDGQPLDVRSLSFPDLAPVREKLISELVDLAADLPASLAALGLSERQSGEVRRNADLLRSPTLPALARYTGVLYDALDLGSLRANHQRRALGRLGVASALFGLVRGGDPIPAYRLSATSALPGIGPLRAVWRPALGPVLAGLDELTLDLRSGPYAGLAPAPGTVTVRVVTEDATGRRTAISHHNKAYKGRLARALATATREPNTVEDILRAASTAGLRLDRTGPGTLDLIG